MKVNKFFLSTVAVLFCFTAIYADDVEAGSVKEPGKNKVVLVGRVSFKTPIDIEARREALGKADGAMIKIGYKGYKNIYGFNESGSQTWELEEPFYSTMKLEKDETVSINSVSCILFGNPYASFTLPMGVKIAIPEGAKYVYVGDFEYDLDYALRVVGFKHIDEYDAARKQINRAVGKEVELVRGELTFLTEEDLQKK